MMMVVAAQERPSLPNTVGALSSSQFECTITTASESLQLGVDTSWNGHNMNPHSNESLTSVSFLHPCSY